MLTSTCPNSGCGSSVSAARRCSSTSRTRAGGSTRSRPTGKVLRVATKEDMDEQARLEQSKHAMKRRARAIAESLGLPMKIVEAEPILGGERLTIYYTSEDRVDFRELVRELGPGTGRGSTCGRSARGTRRGSRGLREVRAVLLLQELPQGAQAHQHASAKVQKATLDPVKISGRCGRLMCCLRYEDETYDELRKRLPNRKKPRRHARRRRDRDRHADPDAARARAVRRRARRQATRSRRSGSRASGPRRRARRGSVRPPRRRDESAARAASGRRVPRARNRERRDRCRPGGRPGDGGAAQEEASASSPEEEGGRRRGGGDAPDRGRPRGRRRDGGRRRDARRRRAGPGQRRRGTGRFGRTGDGDATPAKKKRRRRRRRRRSGDGPAAGGEPGGERPGGPGEGGGDG
jgi:hypothetical protein